MIKNFIFKIMFLLSTSSVIALPICWKDTDLKKKSDVELKKKLVQYIDEYTDNQEDNPDFIKNGIMPFKGFKNLLNVSNVKKSNCYCSQILTLDNDGNVIQAYNFSVPAEQTTNYHFKSFVKENNPEYDLESQNPWSSIYNTKIMDQLSKSDVQKMIQEYENYRRYESKYKFFERQALAFSQLCEERLRPVHKRKLLK